MLDQCRGNEQCTCPVLTDYHELVNELVKVVVISTQSHRPFEGTWIYLTLSLWWFDAGNTYASPLTVTSALRSFSRAVCEGIWQWDYLQPLTVRSLYLNMVVGGGICMIAAINLACLIWYNLPGHEFGANMPQLMEYKSLNISTTKLIFFKWKFCAQSSWKWRQNDLSCYSRSTLHSKSSLRVFFKCLLLRCIKRLKISVLLKKQ